MQLCSKVSRSITWDPLHRDWRCCCDVEWLTLFLECTSNVLCNVVIMNVCGKNGLFEVGQASGAIDDYFSTMKGSRDNVVWTRLQVGRLRNRGWIPSRGKRFCSFTGVSEPAVGTRQPPIR